MDLQLKDKVVIITGAAGGIGNAITKAFLAEGARLALTSTRQEKIDALLKELGNPTPDRVRGYVMNVANEEEVKQTINQIAEDFGSIYSMISNAGSNGDYQELKNATRENYERVFDINVFGVLWNMKYVIPHLEKAGEGSIVVIGSEGSYVGAAGMGHYVASKHAVAALTKSAAMELGGKGIHCNFVAPSAVKTDMMIRIGRNTFGDTKTDEEAEAFFAADTLDKRYATPEEVAAATIFFASPLSAHTMGWGMRIDGGKHIQ